MTERDPEGMLFASIDDYLIKSKDSIWYKVLMYIYLTKGHTDEFTVESKEYYDALDTLINSGVVKSHNYRSMMPFVIFAFYCWDRLKILKYVPFREFNESVVLHFKNTEVLEKTAEKIDPEEAFRKEVLRRNGELLNEKMKELLLGGKKV